MNCEACGRPLNVYGDATKQQERAALEAGTHEPAVDDFGNQYLVPVSGQLRRVSDTGLIVYEERAAALDMDRLTRALTNIRVRGEMKVLSGEHIHHTDAELAALIASEYES